MAVKRSVLYVAVPQTAVLLFMGHICVAKSRPSLRTTSVRGCVGDAGPALPVSAQSRILNVFFTFLALFFLFYIYRRSLIRNSLKCTAADRCGGVQSIG